MMHNVWSRNRDCEEHDPRWTGRKTEKVKGTCKQGSGYHTEDKRMADTCEKDCYAEEAEILESKVKAAPIVLERN